MLPARRRQPARVFYPAIFKSPLAALRVDPDPELQVRHRRTRGRAMVREMYRAGERRMAAQLRPRRTPELHSYGAPVIDPNPEPQIYAEPTKMQRPVNWRKL
jgi:hypothetical protein